MSYGSKCPPGAVHYQSNCFFFMNNATNFENAELTCKNNFGAHLLSIPDLFTDSVIGLDGPSNNVSEYWIGGIKKSNGTWSWTDGTPFVFTEWQKGEPKNQSNANCIMYSKKGFWYSKDCKESHAFICSVPTALLPVACDEGWQFFNETGYCYEGYPGGNLSTAEKTCKQNGGHLVSIHSKAENDFVGGEFHIDGPYHRTLTTWIGLYRKSSQWKWSDGSVFNYRNWAPGSPKPGQNCVTQFSDSPFYFQTANCAYNFSFNFVCKKLPTH